MLVIIKNCERSEFCCTYKVLASHSFRNATSRHESPRSETKDMISDHIAAMWALSLCHFPFPIAPKFFGGKMEQPSWMVRTHSGFASQTRTSELTEPKSFWIGCSKSDQPLLWSKTLSLWCWAVNTSSLCFRWKHCFSLSFLRLFALQTSLKRIFWPRAFRICWEDVQKCRRLTENCLPTILDRFYRQNLCARHDTSYIYFLVQCSQQPYDIHYQSVGLR